MLNLICVICSELFNETDDVYATECGHIFHNACLRHWLESSRTCPQCRKTCSGGSICKLYIDSAIESSEHLEGARDMQQTLELYEEVNLNLKRELEMSEGYIDKCETKLHILEINHKRVQNNLKVEIEKRMNSEKQVADLEKDKLHLTEALHNLKSSKGNRSFKLVQSVNGNAMDDQIHDAGKSLVFKKDKPALQEKYEEDGVPKKVSENVESISGKKDAEPDALLFGIPKQPAENVEAIFYHFCRTINCVPPILKAIYRSRHNKADSPIILKFGSLEDRNAIFKAIADYCKQIKRELCPLDFGITCAKTKRICMREWLTSKNRSLLQTATCMKRRKQLYAVYTRFGSVYVKQSAKGPSIKIENEDMLNAIAAKWQAQIEEGVERVATTSMA